VVMPFRTFVTAVIGAALILLTVFGVDQFILYTLPAYAEIEARLAESCLALLTVLMLLFYGLCRGVSPYTNPDYLKWLESTPWTLNLPLPLCSPINLIWQDAVVVGCAMLLWSWGGIVSVLYLPVFFVAPRLFQRIVTNIGWVFNWGFFIPAALLLAIVPVYDNPPLVFALALAAELVTTAAMRKGLRRFPLMLATWQQHNRRRHADCEHRSETMNGWPLVEGDLSDRDGILSATSLKAYTAVLSGWATFCMLYHLSIGGEHLAFCWFVYMAVAFSLALVRTNLYCNGFDCPLSLWVRLVKWRWIVPGYDKVFVTPLVIVAIGLFVPLGVECVTGSIKIAMAVGIAAVVSATFFLGPSLERWQYLGQHGISGTVSRQNHVKI